MARQRSRANGSVYKRRREDGSLEPRYTIQWHDENGVRRTARISKDKSVAEAALAQKIREVERRKAGIIDEATDHHRESLGQHAAAFLKSIQAKNCAARYLSGLRFRLTKLLARMDAKKLSDYRLDRVQEVLAKLLADGSSVSTRDHYAALARQFGKWLFDTGRLKKNPMQTLTKVCRRADRTRNRFALDPADIPKLLAATATKPAEAYLATHPNAPMSKLDDLRFEGEARAVIYALAATNGLRRAEIAALRWSHLRLDENPRVILPPEATKNGEGGELPLIPSTVERLRQYLARVHERTGRLPRPQSHVVRMPDRVAVRVREDAARAGISIPEDREFDLHALRTTYATSLSRAQVPIQAASRLLRHTDVRITIDFYTKLDDRDLTVSQDLLADLLDRALTAKPTATPSLSQADTVIPSPAEEQKAEGQNRG
ncbi:MAG: tyrosine-type recombinase/integrase [Planctomycetota bacterium]